MRNEDVRRFDPTFFACTVRLRLLLCLCLNVKSQDQSVHVRWFLLKGLWQKSNATFHSVYYSLHAFHNTNPEPRNTVVYGFTLRVSKVYFTRGGELCFGPRWQNHLVFQKYLAVLKHTRPRGFFLQNRN
jgi:hypothetical protein